MSPNTKSIFLESQTEKLSRIETLLEIIYDQLQALREPENDEVWFTPEIQAQVEQAQSGIKGGDYTEFANPHDLITHLHSVSKRHVQI